MSTRNPPDDAPNTAAETGLLLFRSGRRAEAIPLLREAAAAGDPRAQYLLGVALFNGDHVAADPDHARTLLAAAAAGGIDQARVALADIASTSQAAHPAMLLSASAAARTAAEFARLEPTTSPATLEALTRDLLVPLLRERLEEALPRAACDAVDRALQAGAPVSPIR